MITDRIIQVRGKVSNDVPVCDVLVDLQLDDKEQIVSVQLAFGVRGYPADGAYRVSYDFNGRSYTDEVRISRREAIVGFPSYPVTSLS